MLAAIEARESYGEICDLFAGAKKVLIRKSATRAAGFVQQLAAQRAHAQISAAGVFELLAADSERSAHVDVFAGFVQAEREREALWSKQAQASPAIGCQHRKICFRVTGEELGLL